MLTRTPYFIPGVIGAAAIAVISWRSFEQTEPVIEPLKPEPTRTAPTKPGEREGKSKSPKLPEMPAKVVERMQLIAQASRKFQASRSEDDRAYLLAILQAALPTIEAILAEDRLEEVQKQLNDPAFRESIHGFPPKLRYQIDQLRTWRPRPAANPRKPPTDVKPGPVSPDPA